MGTVRRTRVAAMFAALAIGMVTVVAPSPGEAQAGDGIDADVGVEAEVAGDVEVADRPAVIGEGVLAAVDDGPALVVVALDAARPGAPAVAAPAIAQAQDAVLVDLPDGSVDFVHRFTHVPALTLMVRDRAAIDTLEAAAGVARVDLDLAGTGALVDTVPFVEADRRHATGNDGDGVVVAILDSGIDGDHPDLVADNLPAGQACFGWNNSAPGVGFCPDGSDSQTGAGSAEDDAGHGTHVTGTITSDGVVTAGPGLAPGVETIGLKVTDNCNQVGCFYSFSLNIVAALDYLIDNPQLGVQVVNMSLWTAAEFPGHCDDINATTMAGAAAVDTLWDRGVIAFAAAGNSGSGNMAAPACLSNVVSVAASTDADQPTPFTNASPTTDLFAPGLGVVSSFIGGGVATLNGTSAASPVAAGCAALLIESGEATTPAEILARLTASSATVTAANGLTYPRIDCGNDQATILPQQCQLYLSPFGSGPLAGPLAAGETRTLQVVGPIPTDQRPSGGSCVDASTEATAAILLVSAFQPTGVGNLRVSPAGVAATGGVVNYNDNGLDNANVITVPLSADGRIDVFANQSATGLRVSVLGFYGPTGSLDYVPVTPCAVFDTRTATGTFAGPAGAGDFYVVDVVGPVSVAQGTGGTDCGVPADADSVVFNLVAVRPPGGFGGSASLEAMSLGLFEGQGMTPFADLPLNNATSVVVPLDGNDELRVGLVARGTPEMSHIRMVMLGYFTEQRAQQYVPVTPCAAFDSRTGTGTFGGKRTAGTTGVTTYDLTGAIPAAQGAGTDCGVPDGAEAVLINLVAIQPDAVGNFRAYATGSTPTGGVLNFAPLTPAMNNSNAVVVPLSATGQLDLFVNAPSADGDPTVHARGVVLGYYR